MLLARLRESTGDGCSSNKSSELPWIHAVQVWRFSLRFNKHIPIHDPMDPGLE
ncbi:Hypothetical predicted protein, partial [Podarcis lilfordi]